MTRRDSTILLAVLACGACGPTVDIQAEEDAIRRLSARWLELNRQEDAAGIAALFAEDGTLHWEDRPFTEGRTAIQEFLTGQFAEVSGVDDIFGPDHIDVAASGDLAVERGTYENPDQEGRYTTVYRKLEGEWRVQADMSVSAGPDGGAPEWARSGLATWYERFNARDAEALADLYTPTAVVGEARGRAAIIRRFRDEWAERNETCSGGHDEFIVVGSVAVGAGRDLCTAPSPDGTTRTARYRWLAVHERQSDDTWLLVRDLGEEIQP